MRVLMAAILVLFYLHRLLLLFTFIVFVPVHVLLRCVFC